MSVTAIHLLITGRVQGVGYRAWTVATARSVGVGGWVRNRRDGSVEAVFCGTPEQIDTLRAQCARGPLAAKVTRMDETIWQGERLAHFEKRETV